MSRKYIQHDNQVSPIESIICFHVESNWATVDSTKKKCQFKTLSKLKFFAVIFSQQMIGLM